MESSIFSQTPLILKSYWLYRALTPLIQLWPKPWRYGIGEKLQTAILVAIDQTGQALYARQPLKEPYILKIIGTMQTVQLFIRLAYDEKLLEEQHFFSLSDRVQELNRMAIGWLVSARPPHPGQAISPKTGGVDPDKKPPSPRDGNRS